MNSAPARPHLASPSRHPRRTHAADSLGVAGAAHVQTRLIDPHLETPTLVRPRILSLANSAHALTRLCTKPYRNQVPIAAAAPDLSDATRLTRRAGALRLGPQPRAGRAHLAL